jgi:hypothetical protein
LNLLLQFYLRLFVYQLIAYYSLYAATNCSAIAKISVASKSGVLDSVQGLPFTGNKASR